MRAERIGATTVILTRKSSNLYYNRWIAAGCAAPASEAQLERAIAYAREHRVASLGVSTGPGTRPAELGRWLEARGFRRVHPGAKLWRGAEPLPRPEHPSTVTVRKVRGREVGTWIDVVSRVWRTYDSRRAWYEARAKTPGWTHYLAWIDGEPVGAGALFLGEVGETKAAHLVDGVTLPAWRRRGVQAAIIRRRVGDARRAGCSVLTSETAPPLPRMPLVSFRNLCRQGFRFGYLRESWRLDFA